MLNRVNQIKPFFKRILSSWPVVALYLSISEGEEETKQWTRHLTHLFRYCLVTFYTHTHSCFRLCFTSVACTEIKDHRAQVKPSSACPGCTPQRIQNTLDTASKQTGL